MSKKLTFLFLIFLSFSFLPLSFLQETNTNSTTNETVDTNEDFEEYNPDKDPENIFNKLDFKNVREFEDYNYNEIADYDLVYLFFYSKSCQFSQYFIQEFVKAADYCAEKKMKVKFGKIDVRKNPTVSKEYGVDSFPIVYLVHKQKRYLFEGNRIKQSLLNFMERKLHNDIVEIKKLSEINRFVNDSYLVFLSTIKDNTTMIYKSFYNYAKNNSRFFFIKCLSEECLKKYQEDIILIKKEGTIEYSYVKNYEKLDKANLNSLPNFASFFSSEPGEFLSYSSIDLLYEFERKSIFYIRDSANQEHKNLDKLFVELGKELRKKNMNVFTSDIGEELGTNIGSAFSLENEELPAIVYYNINSGDKKCI